MNLKDCMDYLDFLIINIENKNPVPLDHIDATTIQEIKKYIACLDYSTRNISKEG